VRTLNMKSSLLVIFVLLLLAVSFIPLVGQAETIITVAIPEWQQETFNDAIFAEFEAAHPGVKIVPVFEQPTGFFFSPESGEEELNAAFDRVLESTSKADIMQVQSYSMSVEMTRAGYFLDLAPLINNDPSFDTVDFFPVVWESYQWDRGIWAIPTSVNAAMLIYDAKKFDEAGLTYPNENWTLTDLANAAEAFTEYDNENNAVLPGLTGWNIKFLIISLLGESLLDQDVMPNEPRLDSPELQALINEWNVLLEAGSVQPYGEFDTNDVAMAIDYTYRLQNFNQQDEAHQWAASLLPGGKAGLDVSGFAISAGTANPELAYELVKYMSLSPAIGAASYGEYPARRSLVGVVPDDLPFTMPEMEEDIKTAFESALENGIPVADTQFYSYISRYFEIYPGPSDSERPENPSLDQVQQDVEEILAAADARRTSQVVAVATVVPTPVIQQGEVVLRFRLGVPFSPLPNRETWDDFLVEFSASDPTVGNVDLVTGFGTPAPDEEVDCYYTYDNFVPTLDLTTVIALDPFMDADPNFDEADVLGSTLSQLRRENATWGYPMTLQPSLISYNSTLFEDAGIEAPTRGWTIDEFVNKLQALMDSDLDLEYAFDSNDFGATHLYMFIAAYGGDLFDYSTTPVTYHLTDPASVTAIQQVLDLAKANLIRYRQLDNNTGGGGFSGMTPMQATSLSSLSWDLGYRLSEDAQNNEFVNPTRYTLYPRGNQSTPLSYTIGTGYITSTAAAADPEACYRLLTEVSRRPELLLGVPARRSLVEDPQIATLFGEDIAEFFVMFAEQLDTAEAVIVPSANSFNGSYTTFFESIWINQAFDNYVLEDGDLEADLALAETNIQAYRTCVGDEGTPPDLANMEQAEIEAYFAKYTDCAVQVDPSLEGRFDTE
jgi:ABC-type glycerol-3-phosphate transport system substrate-binding protein